MTEHTFNPRYGYEGSCTALEWLLELGQGGVAGLRDDDRAKLESVGVISNGVLNLAKLNLLSMDTVVVDAVILDPRNFPVEDPRLRDMHPQPRPPNFGHGVDHPNWRK